MLPACALRRLLPTYAPPAPTARPKPARSRYSLAYSLGNRPYLLPVVVAALLLIATQIGIRAFLSSSELKRARAWVVEVDKRGYTLAMRVAWLEEALLLANSTSLTGNSPRFVFQTGSKPC